MNTGLGQGSGNSIRTTASIFKAVPQGSKSMVWLCSEQVGVSTGEGRSLFMSLEIFCTVLFYNIKRERKLAH